MVKWVRVLRNKKKIERSWEVLSKKGSERVLEPWGAGVERGAKAGQWLGSCWREEVWCFFF